jgi:tetratricopeptide (TPR) repeat protein
MLPARDTLFLRGLSYYLAGTADSAVAVFKRLATIDGDRSEAWMALGEVYYHLQPEATDLDSLAEEAFVRARAIDPEFTPPLYHLAGLALKRGAMSRADSLVREYGRVEPDSSLERVLDVALRCARGGPPAIDWMRMAAEAPLDAVEAGVLLAGGAAHIVCARDALWAVLNTQGTSTELRWGALFALQSVLIAAGRDADVPGLFRTPAAAAVGGEDLLLLDGSAGAAVQELAAKIASERGANYRAMSPFRLWLLGSWESHRQRGDKIRAIGSALVRKADSSRTRRDSLLARAIEARSAVLSGDTTLAIRRLRALKPTAPLDDLFWDPAEGLGGERLLLAQLLLVRGDYAGAVRTASQLDGSGPVVYLLYLRSSLMLRARAAEAMGDSRGAARYRERLARLAVDTGRPPWERTLSVNYGGSR